MPLFHAYSAVQLLCSSAVLFIAFQVTYRSYASSQLLSGWTPQPAQQTALSKKEGLTNSAPHDTVYLKGPKRKANLKSCQKKFTYSLITVFGHRITASKQ